MINLTRRFIVITLVVLTVGQAGIFAWTYAIRRDSLQTDLDNKISLTLGLLRSIAGPAFLDKNFASFGSLMEQVLKDRDFVEIDLLNDGDVSIVRKESQEQRPSVQELVVPVVNDDEVKVGTLKLKYTPARIDIDLKSFTRTALTILILVQALIFFIIVRLFQREITRRIRCLAEQFRRVTDGDLSVQIPASDTVEFKPIISGFNYLVLSLSGSLSKVLNLSDRVAANGDKLQAMVRDVQHGIAGQHLLTSQAGEQVQVATLAQQEIVAATGRLFELTHDNASSLEEIRFTSDSISSQVSHLSERLEDSRGLVRSLTRSSGEVTEMSRQTQVQVAQVSCSVADISGSVARIEQSVSASVHLSSETTRLIADRGIRAVDETTRSMRKIHDFVAALNEGMGLLATRSRDIVKILAVIREVTDKTKLLALNASIIAAQAGERGKSFAVVAGEMKALSDMTATSTLEIDSIVNSISSQIEAVVAETAGTIRLVEDGELVVAGAGEALGEMLQAARTSQEMTEEIQQATADQSLGVSMIVAAVEELSAMNERVREAVATGGTSACRMEDAMDLLQEFMAETTRATREQMISLKAIAVNMEDAKALNGRIFQAAEQQQEVNAAVVVSMGEMLVVGDMAVNEVTAVAENMQEVVGAVASLQRELQGFTLLDAPGEEDRQGASLTPIAPVSGGGPVRLAYR